MNIFPSIRRYYLYQGYADMRKSFNGLGGLVNMEMEKTLQSGDGFIFINKRRNMVKVLVWDRNGYVIYYKRLASGSFEVPENLEISATQLLMILEGIELNSIRLRKRFSDQKRA